MKALSIISLVISVFSILLGIGITTISCYHNDCNGYGGYISRIGKGPGAIVIFISLWFLAFSIVATVVSFKKKK